MSEVVLFDINNFKKDTNYCIEASAGTGKTFSIKNIVRKLVYEYHVSLDKILIVTYTEKAAGELKERIRETLCSSDKSLNGKSVKSCLPLEVGCDIDNASIGTIHSFCQSIIKEFPISSNLVSNLDVADDNVAIEFANSYIRCGDIVKDISELLGLDYRIDPDKLVKKFTSLNNLYYLNYKYKEDKSIAEYLSISDSSKELALAIKLLFSKDVLKDLNDEEDKKYLDAYKVLVNSDKPLLNVIAKAILDFKLYLKDTRAPKTMGITKKDGYTVEEIDAISVYYELNKTFNAKFNPESYLVDKYLLSFYKAYQEFKTNNHLQTFNDMIRNVKEEICKKDSKLLAKLQDKYQYAIIDEFQDTNELQFTIFKKIFLSPNHNLIVVGDPKQSIYSFQGTDVSVYSKAVEEISANGVKLRLGKNYRSSAGVVSFGNALFKGYDMGHDYIDSDYCSSSRNEAERVAIYNGEIISGLWTNETPLSVEEYAKFVVEQIIKFTSINPTTGKTNLQLLKFENGEKKYKDVDFNSFMILGKSRNEFKEVKDALTNAGIPFFQYKDESLFTSVEAKQWIALLEAINVDDFTGKNRGFYKKALFTRFFDIPINILNNERYSSDIDYTVSLFAKWHKLAKDKLWQDLFDTIFKDTYLNERLSGPTDSKSLGFYKQISDYAIDYLSNGHTLKDLIDHLDNVLPVSSSDEDEEGSNKISRNSDFPCVKLMTMHSSKGLQFPVVISMGGAKGPGNFDGAYRFKAEIDGVKHNYVSLLKGGSYDEDQIKEVARLYYVAYTRPEYLLIAPRYDFKKPKWPKISEAFDNFINDNKDKTIKVLDKDIPLYQEIPYLDTSYNLLRNEVVAILSRLKVDDDLKAKENQESVIKHLLKIKGDKLVYKHSYSSFAHPQKEEDIIDDNSKSDLEGDNEVLEEVYDLSGKQIKGEYVELNPINIPSNYPKGAGLGNAIHEVFERLTFTNFESKLEELIIDRYSYNGIDISSHPDWLEYTKAIVKEVMNAKLPVVVGPSRKDEYFYLKELTNQNKKAEAEFNFNYPHEILKNYFNGFIDLLFKREEIYSILDWKSDTLSDEFLSYSDSDSLKGQVDRRYAIQRVIYSYCLIKWLKNYYDEDEETIFKNHFGGIYYVFVRGCNSNTSNGVYIQTWDSYSDLEKELYKIISVK